MEHTFEGRPPRNTTRHYVRSYHRPYIIHELLINDFFTSLLNILSISKITRTYHPEIWDLKHYDRWSFKGTQEINTSLKVNDVSLIPSTHWSGGGGTDTRTSSFVYLKGFSSGIKSPHLYGNITFIKTSEIIQIRINWRKNTGE